MFKVPQCPFSKLLPPTTLDENCCPSILLMKIMELMHPPPGLYIKLTVLVSIHHLYEQRSNQKSLWIQYYLRFTNDNYNLDLMKQFHDKLKLIREREREREREIKKQLEFTRIKDERLRNN
jgi:hypothetical protein